MFKKSLATAVLVCTVPALANAAWFLSTQARSGGGYLDSFNKAGQVVADGVLTTQHDATDLANQVIAYTPDNANLKVQKVTLSDTSVNGTSLTVLFDLTPKDANGRPLPTPITTFPSSYTLTPVDGHTYAVAASFAADYLKVTAAIDNGTVSPTSVGSIYYGYTLTAPLTFTFSPKAGYTISGVANVPTGATVVGLPATTNSRVTVTLAKGTVINAGFALSATAVNASPYVDAILPQTVTPGSVSMKAVSHNLGTPAFTWSYVSGPKNVATKSTVTVGKDQKVITKVVPGPALAEFPTEVVNASGTSSVFTADPAKVTSGDAGTSSTAKFTAPSTPGQYKFMVTVGGVTKLATVNVVANSIDSANQCQFCHTNNKIDDLTIGTRYQASIHGQSTHSACSACHYGTGSGGHPGTVSAKTVDSTTFLATAAGVVGGNGNAVANGSLYCASCHSVPHSTANLGATCAACHTGTNGTNGTGDAHSINEFSTAFNAIPTALCINCHSQASTTVDYKGTPVVVDPSIVTGYTASIHQQGQVFNGSGCANCHGNGHDATTHATKANVDPATFVTSSATLQIGEGYPAATVPVASGAIFCTACHKGSYAIPHSTTGLGATCAACHTGNNGLNGTGDAHNIQLPSTLTSLSNTLCENCHGQATKGNASNSVYTAYKASVHGGADGDAGHSSCAACHTGSHDSTVHASSANVDVVTLQTKSATVATSHGVLAQGQVFCTGCHNPLPHATNFAAGVSCATCHTSANGTGGSGDVPHNVKGLSCQGCHSVNQTNPFSGTELVSDNNSGVRAVTDEFKKWSHHIVNPSGVAIMDEQCAICHLEGTVGQYGFGVDGKNHMKDNVIHLRNVDDDSKEFAWNPASPDHSVMDNFCLSCHDADGAKSALTATTQVAKLQALISAQTGKTADPLNPFCDTISNQYDKMLRGRVVDADSQFKTDNMSHHAVKGKKYIGRTANASDARAISTDAQAEFAADPALQTLYDAGRFVSAYKTLGNETAPADQLGDDSTLHCGDCHTVGQFKPQSGTNADGSATTAVIGAHGSENEYMLRNSIGTDELHRGAQYSYAPANMSQVTGNPAQGVDATHPTGNFAGKLADGNPVSTEVSIDKQAVPADEVPTAKPFLVCYNCHVYQWYGSVYFSNTAAGGREGGHAEADHTRGNYCNGPYNTSGSGRALTYNAVYGKQVTDALQMGTFQGISNFNFGRLQPGTGANKLDGTTGTSISATTGMNGSGNGGNNIFQIQCINCHNSGPANGFGGIHGSAINTYTDGNGNTQNARRFLPGLGNVGFVPGDPKDSNGNDQTEAQKWEQESGTAGPGCYTLSTSSTSSAKGMANPTTPQAGGTLNPGSGQMFGTWGACNDHGSGAGANAGKAGDAFGRTIIRPISY